MSRFIHLYELPVSSTESVSDAVLISFGRKTVLLFDYYLNDIPQKTGIIFEGTVAVQTRSERCSKAEHIRPYDYLDEIFDSPWIKQQRSEIHESYRKDFNVRHFRMYLDNGGSFEFLAEDFKIIPVETGSWESIEKIILS
jgi:hypothetical protein